MNRIATIPDGKILDYIDGKFRNDTQEEYVRQTIERRLVEEHRYPVSQIAVEFTLKNGSRRPRADIVIFGKDSEREQSAIKIIVECKQAKVNPSATKDGIEQLKSYMSICVNCEWGMWTNSVQRFVFHKVEDKETGERFFEEYNDIPSAEGNIAEIDRPTRNNLKNAVDDNLLFVFRTCHDYIYANDGLHKDKAFFEFLKIIFCKIEDEKNFKSKTLNFYAMSLERKNPDGQLTVKNRIEKIFGRVKLRYPQIFSDTDSLELTPRSLARVVSELQKYSLLNTNIDIKGKAYEEIVGANLRGDRGEFFTPRNVMKMVVAMIDPELDEKVLDSSCGTGGFPVIAMTHVMNKLEKVFVDEFNSQRADWNEDVRRQFQEQVSDLARNNFFAFDLNPDLVKAAKMNMVMNNDGSGNIWQANSLLPPHEWSDEFKRGLAERFNLAPEQIRNANSIGLFDVIVTNPPFGSKIPIDDEHILRQFELAHIWTFDENNDIWRMTNRLQSSVPPEILFVERCTQFLKPGGRIGIVLPDSILGSPGLGYIRTWLIRNHKILASIDLHADTFQPHNGTQTSVLILQKKTPEEILSEELHGVIDYEIFMAQVEKVGHDKRGNTLFKRDDDGREILLDGEKIIDDETAEVAHAYHDWKKKLQFNTHVKFCAVKLSEVRAHGWRLEASVFDQDATMARQNVIPQSVSFSDLAAAHYVNRFKRVYCNKNFGEPFYLPSQITEVRPQADKFISRESPCDFGKLRVHEGQILLTRSGTIGTISYVSKTLAGKILSDDVIRIDTKNFYDAGYIYVYLKSSVGQQFLLTNRYGAVIEHIEPKHLANLPLPVSSEGLRRQIHELIVRSYELRDESNELIDEAERILIDELHLPPIEDFRREKIFSIKLGDLRGRLDASFYAPIVKRIIDHLRFHAAEVTTVADGRISQEVILPGRFKRVYVDEGHGVPFFGGRSIGELDPSDKKYLSLTQHDKKIRDELTIRENMVLITCSGTIGDVSLVPKHWDGWAMTHDIIRLVPTEDFAGYVYVWLQSVYAGEIIKSFSYGAVVRHIEKFHLEAVPVPLLKDGAVQSRINSMALLANEKRFRAYLLEQEALKILDKEVLAVQ